MKISNTFIRRILDSCDLIGILGRILACVGEIGELTYPLPKLGEGRVRVHSDIRNSCHAELARVNRGWNAFAKVDKTILQNVELPFNANEQDISASDQRRMDKFSVSRHCERSEAIQENGDLFRLLRRFTPRNDNKKVGVECQ